MVGIRIRGRVRVRVRVRVRIRARVRVRVKVVRLSGALLPVPVSPCEQTLLSCESSVRQLPSLLRRCVTAAVSLLLAYRNIALLTC
jgi:hypothetical protein